MPKRFNVSGSCNPYEHYMVNIQSRLVQIKQLVDMGQYFTINRGRQYGKTTTLFSLEEYLNSEYIVISLDFQVISSNEFVTEQAFTKALARELYRLKEVKSNMTHDMLKEIKKIRSSEREHTLADLFDVLNDWFEESEKPIVLLIDEVDQASNNQIFLDFLAKLRYYYLNRNRYSTFQSVILAGVHDIRNLKQKIRPDAEHKHNSPWNIAISFDVDMSFSGLSCSGVLVLQAD